MPQLPHSIELHDSKLSAIEQIEKDIQIAFSPAYVHRDGKGWLQEAIVIVHEGRIEKGSPTLPVTIADGRMHTQRGPYDNLLTIPFEAVGPVQFELELVTGDKVLIVGNGVSHEFKGEPVFIEEFPST